MIMFQTSRLLSNGSSTLATFSAPGTGTIIASSPVCGQGSRLCSYATATDAMSHTASVMFMAIAAWLRSSCDI